MVVVTGSGPLKPEISVRSFEPALTVTRSVLPSKLPTKLCTGSMPTENGEAVAGLKKPPPTPWSSVTLFEPLLVTRRSCVVPPVK